MLLKLLGIEVLKVRRSLALLMMFAIALLVVALNVLVLVKQHKLPTIGPEQWLRLWQNTTVLWCSFMMPLYIALVTSLLNGQEHRNHTWRLMLTLPISQLQLFMAKTLLAWLFALGASAVLLGSTALAIVMLGAAGAGTGGAFDFPALQAFGKLSLACLPMVVIQHAVSWRFHHLMTPLSIGVITTMGIIQIGSSEYWIWYPWSYAITAVAGSDAGARLQALLLATGVAIVLSAASAAWLARREVDN
jgi:hypothetical protein